MSPHTPLPTALAIKKRPVQYKRRNVGQLRKATTLIKRDLPTIHRRVVRLPYLTVQNYLSNGGTRQPAEYKSVIEKTVQQTAVETPAPAYRPKKKLALLLPGHNEEMILATTIKTAIAGGQNKRDIYMVDDCSSDGTRQVAIEMLGKDNVLTVERSGKALAVQKAVAHFKIVAGYHWLHIADADSIFGHDYFRIYKRSLDHKKYAVAVGFVQSMRGNWLSNYRAITYTYSQHINRRIQSYLGMISVFPGPITCFRTDILDKLEFSGDTLTEDFDVTLQVHRKNLGKIRYIPQAINYTQDPQTLKDFCRQNLRWQRGFFQGVKKYHIGLHPKAIDLSIGYQMFQTIVYFLQMFVFLPAIIYFTGNWLTLAIVLSADFVVTGVITMFSAAAIKRWRLIGALPYFYFLRWVELGIYVTAFFEILIFGRFKTEARGWATEGRRYKLSANALQDVKA